MRRDREGGDRRPVPRIALPGPGNEPKDSVRVVIAQDRGTNELSEGLEAARSQWRRPLTKIRKKAQQIAIRIGDHELPVAVLDRVLAIPALLKRDRHGKAAGHNPLIERVDICDLDLKIDAAAIWMGEWCGG